MDVTVDGSKVQCCKEQYYIGTWNVSFMDQAKSEVVKQEMARKNIDSLRISERKWTEWENLIQMMILSTSAGKNPIEEMEQPSKSTEVSEM